MAKNLGPTFGDEVIDAGMGGCPITWGATDETIQGRNSLTQPQNTTLDSVIAAHDPTKQRASILTADEFISRWTNAEYAALGKQRNVDLADNKVGFSKNWDIVCAGEVIDLNKKKVINLKADLVAAGILTQQRADAIFS